MSRLLPRSLPLLGALLVGAGCSATPPPAPAPPMRVVGTQTQALVDSATGAYTVQLSPAAGAPAHQLMSVAHHLALHESEGELTVSLSAGDLTLSGTAEEINEQHWIAGLAGTHPETNAPLVMHISVVHAGDQLTGSVVIDADGASYAATLHATRTQATPGVAAAPSTASDTKSVTRYHLPIGLR